MIKHLESKKEFEEFIADGSVIIDFYATWCGPCRMLAPILEEIDEEHGDKIKIAKVDVDVLSDVAMDYMVSSIPTLLFFKNGSLKFNQVGFLPKRNIEKIISEHF